MELTLNLLTELLCRRPWRAFLKHEQRRGNGAEQRFTMGQHGLPELSILARISGNDFRTSEGKIFMRAARILRPTRCVQLALTSCVHPSAITPYNLWQNAYISLLMVLGVGLRQRDEPGNAPPLRGHRILVITRQVDRDRTLAR